MKKLVSFLITILMVGLLAATSWAATGEIAVTQVLGSSNAAPTGPAGFLVDGNPGTAWVTHDQTPGSAWAVLQLKETVRVEGIQLYGPCYGKLTVEYWQDNGWHSFLAADDLAGENFNPGWNLVDLSYDRIVTDKIRIWITNPGALSRLGGIGEIKVLGHNSSQSLERLEPAAVTFGGASEIEHPVGYLFDHNTYSYWRPLTGLFFNNPAVIDLGESCSIERIKIFGSGEAGKGKAKDNSFKLQYLSNGNWLDIPGMTNLSVTEIGPGWKSYNLAAPIAASKIRIVTGSNPKEGGIREIEIWGRKSLPSGGRYLESNRGPVFLKADTAANYSFTIASTVSGPVFLHVVTEGDSATPLTWELNGQSMGNLTNDSAVRGFTVYRQEINPNALWQGANFIRINGADITVRDCKLEMAAGSGLDFSGSPLTDRWNLTASGSGEYPIDLGGSYHLDELVLSYLGNDPQVQVSVYQNGEWLTLSPSSSTGNFVGGELVYSGIGVAGKIKISSGATSEGPAEISIRGSYINDGAPQITFSSPQDGACLGLSEWLGATLQGSIDNPDALLTINGIKVPTNGTGFKVLLSLLGLKSNEDNVIQATAVDSSGRTGTARITVRIGTLPEFTVNLGSGITYTTASSITVSGKTSILTGKVFINGAEVKLLSNFSFSQGVALQEGLNLITVKVSLLGSSIYNIKQFKVVRNSSVPSLKVLSPADGQVVNASQITVSGTASSLTPVAVSVNGKAATVDSGSFTSSPVSLSEGSNTLTVIAKDQNGLTSQAVLTIRRDSAKPVLSGITPAEGAYLNALTVKVTGTISDASPVAVLVNGVAATVSDSDSDKQFSATVRVSEGENTLNIQATDSAGNSATTVRNVFVDTGAPASFTPAANISGWSHNNKPTVTFSTADSGSGIDHYEIGVDGVISSSRAVSPYTFTTAIAEGEHTVQVKAVDKAGNYTTGEVKVFIDTVAPAAPSGFEVIPGIGRVIINWTDPQGEIVAYRITRTPAFSSGSYIDMARSSGTSALAQYIDGDVTDGAIYNYSLQALDHGGNYSVATTAMAVTVGLVAQNVDKNGGTVKFDNCQLNLAENSISIAGQIVIKQTSASLPDNEYAAKTGPVYSFTLLDQAGREIEAKFDEPATLTISYADMNIPSGFDSGDFGVYWYNQEGGYWEKLDYAVNDLENKTITVQLLHFSDYQVMTSQLVSPSLDSYYNMGVSPFQSYFRDNVESISPSSGGLSVSATDLKLPGRSGFDLVIKRTYDSGAAQQDRIIAANTDKKTYRKTPIDTFGCGWSLAIPWVEQTDKGKFIRLPEGQTIKITLSKNKMFTYHAGIHFTMQDTTSLTMRDGTTYEFGSDGKVTKQIDPSGLNTIQYSYDGRKIASITDSVGRVVNFHYATIGSKSLIDKISVADSHGAIRTITYDYNNGKDILTDVYDPKNRHTVYSYQSHALKSGSFPVISYTLDLLKTITYPMGAVSSYSYDLASQKSSGRWYSYEGTKVLYTQHMVLNKVTSYDYTMNPVIGSLGFSEFVPANSYMLSCKITEGNQNESTRVVTQNFGQIKNTALVNSLKSLSSYRGGLLFSSRTSINNNQEYESVEYTYNVPLRAINLEIHSHGGNYTYVITNNYDDWGNPTYRFDNSRNLSETWKYYKQNDLRFKNFVDTYTKTNQNPLDSGNQKVITITYEYNDTIGKPTLTKVNDGERDIVTTFDYDSYGNLVKKLQANESGDLETDFTYDMNYPFPVQKTLVGIKDADGNILGNIITRYGYDYFGNKLWEESPPEYYQSSSDYDNDTETARYRTTYTYDLLNRVTKVTLPGDDTNIHPIRQYIFDDDKNQCDFYNEMGQRNLFSFDGLGRLIQIDKYTGGAWNYPDKISTQYTYDDLDRIDTVTDANTNITKYDYDGMNRVTQVTYPDDNHVTIQYDDGANTVTITDENGVKVAEEHSDWANRLIEARQYCTYDGDTTVYAWAFQYDSFDNKVSQADPNFGVTKQVFDGLNHLSEITLPGATLIKPGATALSYETPKQSYSYDRLGNKISGTSANGNVIRYTYDPLGRQIKATAYKGDGGTVISETKNFYDALGNKIRSIDGNQKEWNYTYSVRGSLLSEADPEGNITRYRYDPLGNKIAVIDPRNTGEAPVTWYTISGNAVTIGDPRTDKSFTTWYLYDNLNRLYRTVLPGDTPPGDPYAASISDSYPHTETTYDNVGNKLSVRDANGVTTAYTYTSRNWVDSVKQNGKMKYSYSYDKKGNQTDITDALNHTTHLDYDSLNRVRQVVRPTALTKQEFTYDGVGNRLSVANGRGDTTYYTYNSLNWLTGVRDPLKNYTQYLYDLNGNQVQAIAANGLVTRNRYDELNRMIEQTDSLNQSTTYSYDGAGNRTGMRDRRGSLWAYQYYGNNLLKRLDVTNGTESYYAEYTYDATGNRKTVADNKNTVNFNFQDGVYQADPLNRLSSVDRSFDGATYRTEYQYQSAKPTLLSAIKYPEAISHLQYKYDEENRLSEVAGFTKPQGIGYNDDDTLQKLSYVNGVITNFTYDPAQRIKDITVNGSGTSVMEQHYTYDDQTNNIKTINDGKTTKTFTYDANNQLLKSVTPGKFMESDPTPGTYGIKKGDYLGVKMMDFTPVLTAMMGLDYNSSSIGIDFGAVAPGIKKIQIIPDGKFRAHRVTQRTLDLYTSPDNTIYTMASRSNWSFTADSEGVITITLKESVATRYLKIHVKFDERDSGFTAKNKATFLNDLAKMLRIYQEASSRTEEFHYDAAGNRKDQMITLIRSNTYSSSYYVNSDRLKTDGKFAFVYDEAGNLVKKGNTFKISGDTVTYTATSGDGVEYWQYTYDLLNRLTEVSKNGTVVADYEYSPDGLRQVKRGSTGTIHYVFEGTEPIFEKRISDSRIRSYIYALGKHLARVDGVIGDQAAKVYYYHTDQVGSVKAMTDSAGKVVYNADYMPFGSQFVKDGEFDELHGFTGKEYDSDTGLYYYNARWYDSELGRFISEDPMADPNNPNLYSYCANDPVNKIDPTGYGVLSPDNQSNYYGYSTSSYSSSSDSREQQRVNNYLKSNDITVTSTVNNDGTRSTSTTTTKPTKSPGVTETDTTTKNYDSEGNLISQFNDTTYIKKDGGTVTVSTSIIGNYKETYYTLRDQYGNLVQDGAVRSVTVIGARGWGDGYQSKTMKARGENPYDDAFIVATGDGRVGFISRANLEGSTAKFTDSEGKVHDGTNPSIAEGEFVINYGLHSGYEALRVNNNDMVGIEQNENPNPPAGRDYMDYCHIHKGGDGWNWSEGCLTVHESQWSNFMSYFGSNPNGVNNGNNAGSLIVTRF